MFPATETEDVRAAIETYRDRAYGWKLTGAGGGGYLILVSDQDIPGTIRIHVRA